MRRVIVPMVVGLLTAALMPPASAAGHDTDLHITTAKAPVAPDGTTAGAPTDFVVTFTDRDPAVPGIGIKAGGYVSVALPDDFVDTGAGGNTAVILQGWPQSPPLLPGGFPWTFDITDNVFTLTLTEDFMPGDFGPGPKQMHLILLGFENPGAGVYPVSVTIKPDPATGDTLMGEGDVHILRRTMPSVNAVSVFSGPPGPPPPFFNPLHQTVDRGEAARQVGLYLWGRGGEPAVGVDLKKMSARHYRMISDDGTVGHVRIDAPRGGRHHELATAGPSVAGTTVVTGLATGVLILQFTPDPDVAGDYTIHIRLNGGKEERLFVSVQ